MGGVGDETDLRRDDRRVEELLLLRIWIIVACQKLEKKFQTRFYPIKFEKEKKKRHRRIINSALINLPLDLHRIYAISSIHHRYVFTMLDESHFPD